MTADKAAPNQKLVEMQGGYKTKNMFAADGRDAYNDSDPPHLIKTTRTGVYNSGSGKKTRYLWVSAPCLGFTDKMRNCGIL